jgi:hypothetical protein
MVNYCTSCNNWNIHRHCSLDFAGGRQGTQWCHYWCHTKINTSKTMLLVDIHSSLFFLTLLWSFLPAFVVSATATLNPPSCLAPATPLWSLPLPKLVGPSLHHLPSRFGGATVTSTASLDCHNAKYSGSPSVFNERRGK